MPPPPQRAGTSTLPTYGRGPQRTVRPDPEEGYELPPQASRFWGTAAGRDVPKQENLRKPPKLPRSTEPVRRPAIPLSTLPSRSTSLLFRTPNSCRHQRTPAVVEPSGSIAAYGSRQRRGTAPPDMNASPQGHTSDPDPTPKASRANFASIPTPAPQRTAMSPLVSNLPIARRHLGTAATNTNASPAAPHSTRKIPVKSFYSQGPRASGPSLLGGSRPPPVVRKKRAAEQSTGGRDAELDEATIGKKRSHGGDNSPVGRSKRAYC